MSGVPAFRPGIYSGGAIWGEGMENLKLLFACTPGPYLLAYFSFPIFPKLCLKNIPVRLSNNWI